MLLMRLKSFVRRILNSDSVRQRLCGEYTRSIPNLYATYSPWFVTPFADLYDQIQSRTLVTADRCYTLQKFVAHCSFLPGEFVECGVYRGGTAYLIATVLDRQKSPAGLHLFDTFEGMPESAALDPSNHRPGDFAGTSLFEVQEFLSAFAFVDYHKGTIPQTLQSIDNRHFAFVHIDVDLYESHRSICAFFYPRMSEGGMMVFDDYGFVGYAQSVKQAVDEFFEDKPEEPIVLPTGQCLVIKTGP